MSVYPAGVTPTVNFPLPPKAGYIVVNGQYVPYTPPTAKSDGEGGWVSAPAAGMDATATSVNKITGTSMSGDDFMKLLVAQLKYQDPSKPADTAQMMQQTASMSMVERVNEMATSTEKLAKAAEAMTSASAANNQAYATMLMEQRMSSAVTLVGRTITYADAADPNTKVSGVVDSVRFDEKGPILTVGGKDVPLAAVSSVKAPTTSASTSSGA